MNTEPVIPKVKTPPLKYTPKSKPAVVVPVTDWTIAQALFWRTKKKK